MKFSIKKLLGRNDMKKEEEKGEPSQEEIFENNKTNFLESNLGANKTFVGVPEFDEIINQITDFKRGKKYGTETRGFIGRESVLTLADGREVCVASAYNKERDYYISADSQHTYVSIDFALNGYASGIDFAVMGAESMFIDKKGDKPKKSNNYVTYVSWPRYSFDNIQNFYVGKTWLGKCFHQESIVGGRFSYQNEEFMIVNQLPVGDNIYLDNGRLYFIKFNTCADYSNVPNPLFRAGLQVKYKSPNLEMYSMEDNGQFNNNSTLEEVEKTFETLKKEKESKTLAEEKQQ